MSDAAAKLKPSIAVLVAEKVTDWTGNRFLDKHISMIESRLTRRYLQLKLESLEDYYKYLLANEDEEKEHLISLLTTHHTYFFRESSHFDFIRDHIIAELAAEINARPDKTIQILSMACSKGHEVYSLGSYLDYNLKQFYPNLDYRITATDVDAQSVEYANNGVYPFEELKRIPMQYLDGYWVRGKGDIANFAKIKADIKRKCEFYPENLLDIGQKTKSKKYDIILCRNVFIYFDQAKITQITQSLMELAQPRGFLMVGISESLRGINEKLAPVGPSVYQCAKAPASKVLPIAPDKATTIAPPLLAKKTELPNPIRVLCVDDSPTIHTVLAKILSEAQGFKIVGKAMNGQEAVDFLKNNTVDAITLDIHMPIMTGVEYLEKHFKENHPPVVMMTSVTRENSDLAFKALSLGASDYVEKPTLHNLKEISQELITKVKSSVINKIQKPEGKAFDKQFAKNLTINKPEDCLNIVISNMTDRDKIKELTARSYDKNISTFVVWDGAKTEEASVIESFFKKWGMVASHITDPKATKVKYCYSTNELLGHLKNLNMKKPKTVTSVTAQVVNKFMSNGIQLDTKVVIEEIDKLDTSKIKRDWNVFPFTSMEYTIFEIFSK